MIQREVVADPVWPRSSVALQVISTAPEVIPVVLRVAELPVTLRLPPEVEKLTVVVRPAALEATAVI